MILSTHAVTGALIGAVASQNLALAAVAGFTSHFLFDTIPHWDYPVGSIEKKGINIENDMNIRSITFIVDLLKIGCDFLVGMGLVYATFHAMPTQMLLGALIGALCAVAPDPLQFVYWKLRPKFMRPLQRFHMYMHSPLRLNDRPIIGILSQVAIMAVTLELSKLLL